MAAYPKTLDLKEPQSFRHYPGNLAGYVWYHKLLLEKCTPGIWISITPNLYLERLDVVITPHITFDRSAAFPAPQNPAVYMFNTLFRAKLELLRYRVKPMHSLWNDFLVADLKELQCIKAAPTRANFGEQIDNELVNDSVKLRDTAIKKNGKEMFVRRISVSAKAAWSLENEQPKGDLRLLEVTWGLPWYSGS